MSISRWMPSALLVGALAACNGAPAGHSPAQTVSVAVEPRAAEVQAGGVARFAAIVTGTADTGVLWEVVEAGGGSVDGSGSYTAPSSPGVFHVRATSRVAPGARAESTVTVVSTPVVAVTVSPRTASVLAGGSLTFSAVVENAANPAVLWSVGGAGCGTITPAGVYVAPATAGVCAVVATSQADPSKWDAATVTVTPRPDVVVTVTPSPATADACTTLAFTATVTGASDTSVTWTVQEGAAGGAVTPAGAYTAPADAGTYHVVATSNADPSRAAAVPVAVTDRILGVAISPQEIQVPPGGTAQFVATVTTSCGAFNSTKTIDSTGKIVAN